MSTYNYFLVCFHTPEGSRIALLSGQLNLIQAMQVARGMHPTAVIEVSRIGVDEYNLLYNFKKNNYDEK